MKIGTRSNRVGASAPHIRYRAVLVWFSRRMASPHRETAVLFYMSRSDRASLRAEAEDLSITVQALLERRIFGYADAERLPPGRTPKSKQCEEQLPLTG